MATLNDQHPERPSTPPMPSLFSPVVSPSSSLTTSPAKSLKSPITSPRHNRNQLTTLPTTNKEGSSEAAIDEDSTLRSELSPHPVDTPSIISMEKDVIYNETTLKYMKIIGRFQELLGTEIELPRLVITGAQSSGKSSLLENLTGLPVPITPKMGTRFPIEITLIKNPIYSVTATIVQDSQVRQTSSVSGNRIRDFKRAYDKELNITEFEDLLGETSDILGLPKPAFARDQISDTGLARPSSSKAISKHTLRIEMRGPDFKNLSLVDTPGLYSAENKTQDRATGLEIEKLVSSLISEKRTIIIAVMDAHQDVIHQTIFNHIKMVDEAGERTVGVLTKCDNLPMGQRHDVQAAIDRAANKELTLTRGWYVIKNRSSSEAESGLSILSARHKEEKLFSSSPWGPRYSGLPESRMGIKSLRDGLSTLFCAHIHTEVPKFKAQVREKFEAKKKELDACGPARSSPAEQRDYLNQVVVAYQAPKLLCLHDNRRHAKPDDPTLIDRKLAVVKKTDLRDELEESGCVWKFETPTNDEDLKSDAEADALLKDENGTESIYTWINTRFQSSKACEVPGLIPYPLVERLFEEQTENWVSITKNFTAKVEEVLKDAVKHCLRIACTNPRVLDALWQRMEKRVEEKIAVFLDECLQLIEQHRCGMQIVACETYFVSELNVARTKRFISAVARLESTKSVMKDIDIMVSPKRFMVKHAANLGKLLTDDRQAVYQIHDILKTYYILSLGHYTETVCKNLLHKNIVTEVMDTYSHSWVAGLSNEEVEFLAGESSADRKKRLDLQGEVKNYETAIQEAEEILRETII